MSTWPATLPPPVLNSLRETPPMNTIRSTVDKGPAKVRRRTTANVRNISFTLLLSPALVETLDIFYVTTTFSGADEFDYTHPRTGVACKARFVSQPEYSEREGVLYTVPIALEILP
jgi:hypothetical protein